MNKTNTTVQVLMKINNMFNERRIKTPIFEFD